VKILRLHQVRKHPHTDMPKIQCPQWLCLIKA